MKNKDLVCISQLSTGEIKEIFSLTKDIKAKQKKGEMFTPLTGKTLGMIFMKSSTRTRVSFEVGMFQLGGHALFLGANELQLGKGKETIQDTARVLSRYLDGIMIRTFAQKDVDVLAKEASIPVINGLTDLLHPCQVLSDLFTIKEKKGCLKGLKISYIGDGNNVVNSFITAAGKLSLNLWIASPSGYEPNQTLLKEAVAANMSSINITSDIDEVIKDADILYTDVWASMGQESEKEKRLRDLRDYQINSQTLKKAKSDVMVMHCLPANRGEEITDEVMDGPHSIVYDQAENRLHVQKAIMTLLMSQEYKEGEISEESACCHHGSGR